jgi:phosphatidylglycerol lysyltransferase
LISRPRWWPALAPLLRLSLLALALVAVDRVLRDYPPGDLTAALGQVPLAAVAAALAASALGYLALVGQDLVAFRILGRAMPLRRMLVPSFVSFAVSASAPASMISGGGVRYRMYRPLGVGVAEAAALAVIDALTWLVGLLLLAGAMLVLRPLPPGLAGHLPVWLGRLPGLLMLAGFVGYFLFAALRSAPIRVRDLAIPAPGLRGAGAQLAVSIADWVFSSGALYLLLAAVEHVSYLDFLSVFFIAQLGTFLLPVPGGLGVFEALILVLQPGGVAGPAVLAALLMFRVVYYLLPLLLAGALLLRRELTAGHGSVAERARAAVVRLAPHLLAAVTFLAGGLLFLTGAIPRGEARVQWLARILPPALIDASHFLASVVGAALLVVAWGLERRARLAYRLSLLLFGWGIVLALTRSADLGVAFFLAVALGVLLAAGRAFPRRGPGWAEPMGALWAFGVGAALLVSIWIGLLNRRWAAVQGETWWRFTLFGDAPAHVRAAIGGTVALLLIALARLLARRSGGADAKHAPPHP